MTSHVISGLAESIALVAQDAFPPSDWYSSPKNLNKLLSDGKHEVLLYCDKGRVVGYYLLEHRDNSIEGVRLAVSSKHRKHGLGAALVHQAVLKARAMKKTFTTYTRKDNYASFNLHVRCGMKLVKADNKYLYLSTPENR